MGGQSAPVFAGQPARFLHSRLCIHHKVNWFIPEYSGLRCFALSRVAFSQAILPLSHYPLFFLIPVIGFPHSILLPSGAMMLEYFVFLVVVFMNKCLWSFAVPKNTSIHHKGYSFSPEIFRDNSFFLYQYFITGCYSISQFMPILEFVVKLINFSRNVPE